MSCESRLYIVEKQDSALSLADPMKRWAAVIAVYEACRFPALREVFQKETNCYILDSDGDTEILQDRAGNPLTEASVDEVVACLENLSAEDTAYRRAPPLLAMLRAFLENADGWNELAVLHYTN